MNKSILKYCTILFILFQLIPVIAANNGQGTNNDLIIDISPSDSFARNLKLQAIEDLDAINLTGKSDSFLVNYEKVRTNLEMSLVDGEFQGPDHISNGTLFHDDKKAIENLLNLVTKEDDEETRQHLESALTHLIQSDWRITQISLEELQLISTIVEEPEIRDIVEKNLTFSQKKFDEAVSDIETNKFNSVITKLHLSWNHSNGALLVAGKYVDPLIVIDSPTNNSYTNNPDAMISGIVIKAMVYTIEYVDLFHNGAYSTTPLDYGVFGKDIVLFEGTNELTVNATDIYGNTGTSTVFVVLDTKPPEIAVTGVENDRYYQTNVTAKIIITDENIATTRITLDGIDYISGTEISDEMEHVLEVHASDLAGNTASETVVFTIDRTLPDVSINGPLHNDFVREIVNIHGIATDANLDLVNLLVDGSRVSSSIPFLWNTQLYNDGIHSILLKALDKAGNRNEDEVQVTVDNTPPVISIEGPSDNYYTNHDVEIAGSVTDVYLESFYVKLDNEIMGHSLPLLWEIQDYPDKVYTISVGARDKAGNTASTILTVTLDTVPPELNVTEQPYYPVLSIPNYTVWGTTEPGTAVKINGKALDNINGNFTKMVTLIKGINTIEVVSTDLANNFNSWNKTIMLDEDDLPDWYEIDVLGTDPLEGDSNSSKTVTDESDNGINDDYEDFDNDGLLNRHEFAYGLDPFNPDTDGDGLTDWYELRIFGTNPLSLDSDDNGVNDPDEDPDEDLLDNLAEQGYNTNPFSNDTDEDGLFDYREISELGTDPLKKDTDDDFLEDSVELKPFFNTDPLNPDTNGNGILDGHELYEQTFANEALGVEITINASDDREETFIFKSVDENFVFGSDMFIGNPVNLFSTQEFSYLTIKIFYNESLLNNMNESDLAIFYYDEENHSFLRLNNQGINNETNYVWAKIDHLSYYTLGSEKDYNNRFYNVNEPNIPEISRGNKTLINARVHNPGEAPASNVKVAFYNGEPDNGGNYLGEKIIPFIGSYEAATASLEWLVPNSGLISIFIKVDPDNSIMETNETNNNAYRLIDGRSIDSDGDGLSDHDEINGLRNRIGTIIYTDPNNPDTDGDGLDDGKEMGPVMAVTQYPSPGDHYYFMFSYPSTNVTGRAIANSSDSDGDNLSDKDEYYFGSSGINTDTDHDELNDFDENRLGTLPRDPDTDRDGLTDGWEAITDLSINPYGPTNPTNRDSDNDSAIDGGESNVYPSTPIDIDGDGVVDSGKQMDLNGDGIIEMGEENYYETPPDEVTYFLDIFAVADQEYVDYYDRYVEGNYKRIIQISVDGADEYFMKQFDIKLNVVEIWHDWNSNDAKDTQKMNYLLDDVKKEYNWESNKRNTDALIAFTGKDPDYEGMADPNPSNLSVAVQIPELSDPRVLEFNEFFKILGIYNAWVQYEWNQRLIQHEVSHLFGAYDYGLDSPNYHVQDNVTGKRLASIHSVMDKTRPSDDLLNFSMDIRGNIWLCNEWNEESIIIMNSNKASVTNGSYKKSI